MVDMVRRRIYVNGHVLYRFINTLIDLHLIRVYRTSPLTIIPILFVLPFKMHNLCALMFVLTPIKMLVGIKTKQRETTTKTAPISRMYIVGRDSFFCFVFHTDRGLKLILKDPFINKFTIIPYLNEIDSFLLKHKLCLTDE